MNITSPAKRDIWEKLQRHQKMMAAQRIESLFYQEKNRHKNFSLSAAGLTLDYSKNLLDETGLQLLKKLATVSGLEDAIGSLFRGDNVNSTEHRAALHTAFRNRGKTLAPDLKQEVVGCQRQMGDLVEKLHQRRWTGANGKIITDIVHIGIGGSDLGPAMACLALRPYEQGKLRIHFVSNLDGTHLAENIKALDPFTTLFVIASKSFATLETNINARSAKHWLAEAGIKPRQIHKHFIAATGNKQAAVEFGVASECILPIWDWVGGRYSVWSAVGITIALQIGMDNYNRFLAGGEAMDQHFATAGYRHNMPVILALLATWYNNFFDEAARLVIPYDHYLNKLPAFLQQLEMESNGKSVQHDGCPVAYHTMGAVFGEAGSNTQHSIHQLLFQGTRTYPVDFIIPAQSHNPIDDHHALLLANCIAQSRALMVGRDRKTVVAEMKQQGFDSKLIETLTPHKIIPGNKPSNILTMVKVTPESLGALIALYEHKVYVQSVIWNINPFDQWSVELGKKLGTDIHDTLTGIDQQQYDDSTDALIAYFQQYAK